jgi:hypothetical protein
MRGHWLITLSPGAGTISLFYYPSKSKSPPLPGWGGGAGVYIDWYIKRKQLLLEAGVCMAFKIACETKEISWVRAIYLNKEDEEIAKVLSPIAWLANKLYAIEEKCKELANKNVSSRTLFTV